MFKGKNERRKISENGKGYNGLWIQRLQSADIAESQSTVLVV